MLALYDDGEGVMLTLQFLQILFEDINTLQERVTLS